MKGIPLPNQNALYKLSHYKYGTFYYTNLHMAATAIGTSHNNLIYAQVTEKPWRDWEVSVEANGGDIPFKMINLVQIGEK